MVYVPPLPATLPELRERIFAAIDKIAPKVRKCCCDSRKKWTTDDMSVGLPTEAISSSFTLSKKKKNLNRFLFKQHQTQFYKFI